MSRHGNATRKPPSSADIAVAIAALTAGVDILLPVLSIVQLSWFTEPQAFQDLPAQAIANALTWIRPLLSAFTSFIEPTKKQTLGFK